MRFHISDTISHLKKFIVVAVNFSTLFCCIPSVIAYINASIVQGSGFGPSSFDIVAAGLHYLSGSNSLAKYADDTYLLVPTSARSTVSLELVSISNWAASNNLRLNGFCACHSPFWWTDWQLCCFDGYFRLKAGICAVVTKVLESFGTGLACRAFSSN